MAYSHGCLALALGFFLALAGYWTLALFPNASATSWAQTKGMVWAPNGAAGMHRPRSLYAATAAEVFSQFTS